MNKLNNYTYIENYKQLDEIISLKKIAVLLDVSCYVDNLNITINQLEKALWNIGCYTLDTTFKGIAIYNQIAQMEYNKNNIYLNSISMSFNKFVQTNYPMLIDKLLPYKQPAEISAQLLKEKDKTCKVLLVTNCIDEYSIRNMSVSNIDYVVSKKNLLTYLESKNIRPSRLKTNGKKKVEPYIQYPFPSYSNCIDGINKITDVLDYYAEHNSILTPAPLYFSLWSDNVMLLSEQGGKITEFEMEQNYRKFVKDNFLFKSLNKTISNELKNIDRFKQLYYRINIKDKKYSAEKIREVYKKINIHEGSKEFNCKACGYGTCEKFAIRVLDKIVTLEHCPTYLSKVNKEQSLKLERMLDELNEAFSLTIPDNRLEKKLKTTPLYQGRYIANDGYFEVINVIDGGLYTYTINCLKLAADLKNHNLFNLIGLDKNTLVQTILFHTNAKTQPILQEGDIVKYDEFFETPKEEALRSATFAKHYYNINDDIYNIIKYHQHFESELEDDFPKQLLPSLRLFKMISILAFDTTTDNCNNTYTFELKGFILYIKKHNDYTTSEYVIDLYREHDFKNLEKFLEN